MAKPRRTWSRVTSRPGTLTPERKDRVDRQLRLELEDVSDAPPVALSAELQEQLVILMADAIAAMVAQEGSDDE